MSRFLACLRKTAVESLRDWKITVFALLFAPAFVLAMSGFLGRGSKPCEIAVAGGGGPGGGVAAFLQLLQDSRYGDGVPHYAIRRVARAEEALPDLEDRSLDAVVALPPGLDAAVAAAAADTARAAPRLRLWGDPRNPRYAVAAILLYTDLDRYARRHAPARPPVEMDETLTGRGAALSEFDLMVPGLVVFALLNVLLTAGAAFLREVDRGTMLRLSLSRVRAWEFVGSISVAQAAISVAAALLTLGAAQACGFRFQGSPAALLAVSLLSAIGVIGLALLTAACLRTVHDLLTVGVGPYMVIMFFSGLMFPLPPGGLLELGGHPLRLQDALPLAASVTAFNRVLNYGAGLGGLGFELALVSVVSLGWFGLGLWAYRRRHMKL